MVLEGSTSLKRDILLTIPSHGVISYYTLVTIIHLGGFFDCGKTNGKFARPMIIL